MSEETQLLPGDVICGYSICRLLGRGGYGAVYLAEGLYGTVALKVCKPEHGHKTDFLKEGRIACRINHPNVVNCLDVQLDEATGLCCLVMEYVDGGTVQQLLNRGEKLDWEWACSIVLSVAKALSAADAYGIVHRDLKPDNIMLLSSGAVKVADLGLAWRAGEQNVGRIQGTPAYSSPEQITKGAVINHRSDIYSLGATLYYLLTKQLPFQANSLREMLHKLMTEPPPDPRLVNPAVPEAVANLVMKMMAKNPADRPQHADKVIQVLNRILRMNSTPKTFSKAIKNPVLYFITNDLYAFLFRDAFFFKVCIFLLFILTLIKIAPAYIFKCDFSAGEEKSVLESFEKFQLKQQEIFSEEESAKYQELTALSKGFKYGRQELLFKNAFIDGDVESVELLIKNGVTLPEKEEVYYELLKRYYPARPFPVEDSQRIAAMIDGVPLSFPETLWKRLCVLCVRGTFEQAEGCINVMDALMYSRQFRNTVSDPESFLLQLWRSDKKFRHEKNFRILRTLFRNAGFSDVGGSEKEE